MNDLEFKKMIDESFDPIVDAMQEEIDEEYARKEAYLDWLLKQKRELNIE